MRAIKKRSLSTNTKTKLDLTKSYFGFSQTLNKQCKDSIKVLNGNAFFGFFCFFIQKSHIFVDLSHKKRSKTTHAAIASTIGTALGTTHGSWRP